MSTVEGHVAAARENLQDALDRLDRGTSDKLLTKAHSRTQRALAALEQEIAARHADRVSEDRSAARELASTMTDARGRRRAPQTMPGYHKGRRSPSKGKRFKATPPTVSEVMRMLDLAPCLRKVFVEKCPSCSATWRTPHNQGCVNPYSERLRAAIYLMWRGGFRVGCELLRLYETDLHPTEGYVFVEEGKGGKTRDVVIDDWVWPCLQPWIEMRQQYPDGPLFCVIEGPNAGHRAWQPASLRDNIHSLADLAGVPHRVNPHGFRHAMALEQLLEGINPLVLSRNMGHSSLQVTDTYFQGLPQSRVVSELRSRPVPQVSMFDVLNSEARAAKKPPARMSSPDLMGAFANA